MVIISDVSFPQESANAVGKRFLELPPVPDFMTLQGPYIKGMKKDKTFEKILSKYSKS